ncbi:hypothetical protein [Sporosarcina sp. P17b]|uniref:hypothetical protein n=1 Tax=Sporosarcina sp. P17b TaxID=2048260 RepID=UPI0013046338|nr:hypothetical protein [Sporosarcina sp. P17b]
MQETLEISRKINEVSDVSRLLKKQYEINKKLENAKERLKTVETMDEHEKITREISTLQNEKQSVETEFELRPKMEEIVLKSETPKIIGAYNKEFKPYHDKYKKLDKKLKEELIKFEKSVRPMVKEMLEIEQMESNFHHVTLKASIEDRKELLKLPVDSGSLKAIQRFTTPMQHSLAGKVYEVINAIERNCK